MKESQNFSSHKSLKDKYDLLDKACEDGDLKKATEIVFELDLRNLRRTETPADVLIPNMITVETFWNGLHIAIFAGNLNIVTFLLEECRIDASSVGRLGNDKYNSDRSLNPDFEAFPLYLSITQDRYECFKYLYLNHGYFWDQTHILGCISLIEAMNNSK